MKPLGCWCLMVALAGCTDEKQDATPTTPDPGEEICGHVEDQGTPLDAAATAADAPALTVSEMPYTVTLPEAQTGYEGFVEIAGPGAVLLFVGQSAVATALSEGEAGADVLPVPAPNEHCPEQIPEHFDLELGSADYTLQLGPTSSPTVWLALTDATGHVHE